MGMNNKSYMFVGRDLQRLAMMSYDISTLLLLYYFTLLLNLTLNTRELMCLNLET